MSLERLTVSERAILRAIHGGATTVDAIQGVTGAAGWWIELCVSALIADGRLRQHKTGFGVAR